MNDREQRKGRFRLSAPAPAGKVVRLKRDFPSSEQPEDLSREYAQRVIKFLSADTNNIVVVKHGRQRMRQRAITRPQIERCVQKGTISEGPFVNMKGQWQVNLTRYAAGEEITCVVAIDWVARLIVITAF